MNELTEQLRAPFVGDKEYRASYAESFMNSCVAAQIKVLREQRGLSQQELGDLIGTKQAGISRLENVNYTAWKVETLTRLARAFDVRLRISFEEFGTLPDEVDRFGRFSLQREEFDNDPVFGTSRDALDEMPMLTESEQKALAPDTSNVLTFGNNQTTASTGGSRAFNVDTPGESPSIHRSRGIESRRENIPSEFGEGPNRALSIPLQQQLG